MSTQPAFSIKQEARIIEMIREALQPIIMSIVTIQEDIRVIKERNKEMLTKNEFYTAMEGYMARQQNTLDEIAMLRMTSGRHEDSIEKLRTTSKKAFNGYSQD